MKQTNIVFWFLVVILLVAAWFLLSFCFKGFGQLFVDLWNDVKDGMEEEKQDEIDKEDK